MLIRDIMTVDPVLIDPDANLLRAAEIISLTEVTDIMVVGEGQKFIGVFSEGDILRAMLPNVDEIISAGGSLKDAFDFFSKKGQALRNRPIAPYIIRNAIAMRPNDNAAMAATAMMEKQIRRVPVVDGDRLVGTISRSDICRASVFGFTRYQPDPVVLEGSPL